MPENVEAGHGVVNLFDKAGVESFDARYGGAPFTFSTEQNEPGAPKKLARNYR